MMTMKRYPTRTGGSLSLVIPRDVVEIMGISEKSELRLSMVGRQLIVEPEDETIPDASFRRSFAAVLRKYSKAGKWLADYDRNR